MEIAEVEKYAVELTDQIRNLTSFKEKLDELVLSVRQIANKQNQDLVREVKLLRGEVDMLTNHLLLKGMPGINRYEIDLKKLSELINSSEWPEAVPSDMIPKTEEEKQIRADTVLDIVVTEFLEGVRFLDMGCGEGHMVVSAANRGAKMAVGFDIREQWRFEEVNNQIFTTEPSEVEKMAPYNVILLYDLIDHIQSISPNHLIHKLKNLLAPSGRIYVRAHPWCSKHGGHLYNRLNKSYIHMILDDTELLRLFGINSEFALKLSNPLETYRKWFKEAGFIIKDEAITTKKVDEFFQNAPPIVMDRLNGCQIDMANLAIEYVDFVLEINESNQPIF
jgi:2-polyprenyl-3-methyl-5-hydroxy-6-metoxy-1,4-benzoquinol methylase